MSAQVDRWKAKEEAQKALQGLAEAIAKELGAPWAYEPQTEPYPTHYIVNTVDSISVDKETGIRLIGKGLARLSLSIPWNAPDRVSIGGGLHVGKNGQYVIVYKQGGGREAVSDITVATKRGAAEIAKEITRRFLPDYLRILALAIAQNSKAVAYQSRTRENLAKLAKITRTDLGKYRDEERTSYSFYTDDYHGEVRVSDQDVTLNLSNLSVEEAEKILLLLFPARSGLLTCRWQREQLLCQAVHSPPLYSRTKGHHLGNNWDTQLQRLALLQQCLFCRVNGQPAAYRGGECTSLKTLGGHYEPRRIPQASQATQP